MDDLTVEIYVTDTNIDYLEIPSSSPPVFGEAEGDFYFSGQHVFVFNNSQSVIDDVMDKMLAEKDETLNIYNWKPLQQIYIVDGDKFEFNTVERPGLEINADNEGITLSDTKDVVLSKLDKALRNSPNHAYEDLKYEGIEGYQFHDSLTQRTSYENGVPGITTTIVNRNMTTYALFTTPTGDKVYSQVRFMLHADVTKEKALSILNDLFEMIPDDLSGYNYNDINNLKNHFESQIDYAKQLSVNDADLEALSNWNKYDALVKKLKEIAGVEEENNNAATNHAPEASYNDHSELAMVGEPVITVTAASLAFDPDGDTLSFTQSPTSADTDVATVAVTEAGELKITPLKEGSTTITVGVTDGKATTTLTFGMIVNPNYPPSSFSEIDQILKLSDQAVFLKATDLASDPENTEVSLTGTPTSSNPQIAKARVDQTTGELEITTGGVGTTTITVNVTDGNSTIPVSFQVTVNPA